MTVTADTGYARRFELPVEFDSSVQAVRARDDGGFLVELADRTYEAGQVVVATGPFQVPFTPVMATDLGLEVVLLHSSQYRTPRQGRRAVHRPTHRRVRSKPRDIVGPVGLRSGFAMTAAELSDP